jgi:hypothetical protein
MKKVISALLSAGILMCAACGGGEPAEDTSGTGDTDVTPDTTATVEVPPVDMVTASHILVSWDGCGLEGITRTQEEAQTLIEDIDTRIQADEITFADAAIEYSDCPSGVSGGDLGTFGRGAMVPPFDEAVFALSPDEMSGVVETQFGYHLIQRTE